MNTHSSLKLLVKSYKVVFPLVLFYLSGEFLINFFFDIQNNFEGFNAYLLKFVGLHTIFYLFCFLLVLIACFQAQHKLTLNYVAIAKQSLMKFIPALFSILPGLLLASIIAFVAGFLFLSGFRFFALTFFTIGLLYFGPQFFVSIYLVTLRDEKPVSSIRKSNELLENGWFSFFLLLLGLVVIKLILTGGLYLIVPFAASEISNLLLLPLTACVIVVQSENLEKIVINSYSI